MGPEVIAAISIGSAIIGAVGQIAQGNSQAKALEFNAQQTELSGRQAQLQAAEEERRTRRDNLLRQGEFAAGRGASGVANEGSVLDVQADAAAEGELRALDARYGGLMASRAAQQDAAFMRAQAKSTRSSARFGAFGTLLGSAVGQSDTLLGSGTSASAGARNGYTAGIRESRTGRLVGGV